jgi:hypothetical protein
MVGKCCEDMRCALHTDVWPLTSRSRRPPLAPIRLFERMDWCKDDGRFRLGRCAPQRPDSRASYPGPGAYPLQPASEAASVGSTTPSGKMKGFSMYGRLPTDAETAAAAAASVPGPGAYAPVRPP